jgi:hypothetical protein
MSSFGVATALSHAVGKVNTSLASVASGVMRDLMRCEACGNACEAPMEIRLRGRVRVVDCFECAIHLMAPACARCRGRIIGQAAGSVYCSPHCARAAASRQSPDGRRRRDGDHDRVAGQP